MHFMLVLAFYYCGTFFCVITPSTFLSMSQVSLSQQGYLYSYLSTFLLLPLQSTLYEYGKQKKNKFVYRATEFRFRKPI